MSDPIGQDELDALLQQAGAGAAANEPADPPAAAPPPAETAPPPAPASSAGEELKDIELLIDHAEQAIASVDEPVASPLEGIEPFEFNEFRGATPSAEKATIGLLRDVELDVKIELGRTEMHLEEVLKLRRGSVVALDKLAGDPVDIYVNGRLIARGEVLVLNDNFCIRVAELLAAHEHEN